MTLDPTYVSAWADQSGNGNDLSQGTAGNRPIMSTMTVSGKPAPHFAPARLDFLANAAVTTVGSAAPATTFFAAFEMGAVSNAFRELIQLGPGGAWVMRTNNNPQWNLFVNGDPPAAVQATTIEVTGNLIRLIASYSGGAAGTSSIVRNAAAPVTFTGASVPTLVGGTTPSCRVGGRNGTFGTTDARLRTAGIYTRDLSASEIALLDGYLARQL